MDLTLLTKLIRSPIVPQDKFLKSIYGDEYAPYYGLMYNLAAQFKSELCVELGVHKGRGIASFALGNPEAIVVGCDPANCDELTVVRDNCPNIRFIQASSTAPETIDQIRAIGRPIDIIHLDTEHNYGQVINEFTAYRDLLAPKAILLFDDTNAAEQSVMRAVNDLPLSWRVCVDDLHPICGYMVGVL